MCMHHHIGVFVPISFDFVINSKSSSIKLINFFVFQSGRPVAYCRLNYNIPVLRLWFNVEAELRQEFCLSRRAMQGLQRLLKRDVEDHGLGSQLEVLIYVYWLAHGLSYRVVSSVFSVPRSTVHRIVNKVARHIQNNLKKVIHFPRAEGLETVGEGFGLLAGHQVFNNAVGAIDGCHIRIKPPHSTGWTT